MKRIFLLSPALAAVLLSRCPTCRDEDGFRPFFNGRDFTGWTQKAGGEFKLFPSR